MILEIITTFALNLPLCILGGYIGSRITQYIMDKKREQRAKQNPQEKN